LTVQIPDVFGQPVGVQTYKTDVQVEVLSPPHSGENNPFSFAAQSVPLSNNPGEVSIRSSLPAEGTLFQYWEVRQQSNGTFAGVLSNNHTAEAIALNLITVPYEVAPNLWLPDTFAMANGTQMESAVDQNRFQARIQGNTTEGTHPFTLDIDAAGSGSAVSGSSIDAEPSNAVPVAGYDSYSAKEDKTLQVRPPGVLRNDSDANGDEISTSLTSGPKHGKLRLQANGSFTYQPKHNFHGTDSFSYSATDGRASSSKAKVTIKVRSDPR